MSATITLAQGTIVLPPFSCVQTKKNFRPLAEQKTVTQRKEHEWNIKVNNRGRITIQKKDTGSGIYCLKARTFYYTPEFSGMDWFRDSASKQDKITPEMEAAFREFARTCEAEEGLANKLQQMREYYNP